MSVFPTTAQPGPLGHSPTVVNLRQLPFPFAWISHIPNKRPLPPPGRTHQTQMGDERWGALLLTRGVLGSQRFQLGRCLTAGPGALPVGRHPAPAVPSRGRPPCHTRCAPDIPEHCDAQGRDGAAGACLGAHPALKRPWMCTTVLRVVAQVARGIHPPFPLLGHLAVI